jgi:hypothetical protein
MDAPVGWPNLACTPEPGLDADNDKVRVYGGRSSGITYILHRLGLKSWERCQMRQMQGVAPGALMTPASSERALRGAGSRAFLPALRVCLTGSLAHWLTGSLAHWLTGSLAHWLTGSLAHWLTG